MLKAVTEFKKVEQLQNKLIAKLKKAANKAQKVNVGYKGGSPLVDVYYIPKVDIWFSLNDYKIDTKYWNAFGVGEPKDVGSNSITVEINYSNKKKPNFRTAGLWATDNDGSYYLMHSGEIGGGKEGINKDTFDNNHTVGAPEEVDLLGKVKTYYLISPLDDKAFVNNIADFVHDVYSIKNGNGTKAHTKSPKNQKQYFNEFFGIKSYSVNKVVTYNSDHGKIVKALKERLSDKGHTIRKDGMLDLAIFKKGKMSHLFEIKTSLVSQNVYSAIGQLYLYSEYNNANPAKYFVCPKKELKGTLKKYLNKLNINVMLYTISNGKVLFDKHELLNEHAG